MGYLSEIFCSVQGEGPYVGQRQIFCRTAGCSLGCRWCDTVESQRRPAGFVVAGRSSRVEPNPVDPDTAVRAVLDLAAQVSPVGTVSLTGGEPLEQPGFVAALAGRLSAAGFRVYLETNGIHASALDAVLPYVDVLAMDIKLPSAVDAALWTEHRAFLARIKGTPFEPRENKRGIAAARKDVFVKVVVDGVTKIEEVEEAARLVAAVNRAIPLILQPESGRLRTEIQAAGGAESAFVKFVGECAVRAEAILDHVRVIPQNHKILGIK